MRAEPATLTPTLSQREREEQTTCLLSMLPSRKVLTCCNALYAERQQRQAVIGMCFNIVEAHPEFRSQKSEHRIHFQRSMPVLRLAHGVLKTKNI